MRVGSESSRPGDMAFGKSVPAWGFRDSDCTRGWTRGIHQASFLWIFGSCITILNLGLFIYKMGGY